MRTEARPPRRKWPWIVGGVIVVAALIVAGVWFRASTSNPPTVPTAAPNTPNAETPLDPDPTGCLGGDARDAAMVLAAQKAAPHTSNGAVEFATALMRWMHQYPVPPAEDISAVDASLVASGSPYDLTSAYASNPNTSGALVPDGTPFFLSTIPGVWNLESYADDTATVTVGTGIVINGELHPTFRMAKTFTLDWEDEHWTFDQASLDRTTEELFSIGTPYTEGC
ncbi:hypothetical protein ACWEOH_05650 [Agromyces sp. NPDC004153]